MTTPTRSNTVPTWQATMSDDVAQAALYLCGVADGRGLERVAIVAWLVGYGLPQVANQIDNGLHLAGDDE